MSDLWFDIDIQCIPKNKTQGPGGMASHFAILNYAETLLCSDGQDVR